MGMGSDHTLFALQPGVVFFHRAPKTTPGGVIMRRFVSVLPFKHGWDEEFKARVAQGPIDAFRRLQQGKEKTELKRKTAKSFDVVPRRAKELPVEPKFGQNLA